LKHNGGTTLVVPFCLGAHAWPTRADTQAQTKVAKRTPC
jgi:hypothetical protein